MAVHDTIKWNVISSGGGEVQENLVTVNFLQHFLTKPLNSTVGWFDARPQLQFVRT
jgi:hypothetical protein